MKLTFQNVSNATHRASPAGERMHTNVSYAMKKSILLIKTAGVNANPDISKNSILINVENVLLHVLLVRDRHLSIVSHVIKIKIDHLTNKNAIVKKVILLQHLI